MDRTGVDPPALRTLGGQVGAVGGTVGNAHGAGNHHLAPPGGHGTGSATAAAARTAESRWYTALAVLATRLTGAGTGLTAAANSYAATDQAAAAHARVIRQRLSSDADG
ncbi:hypothetical protein Lfu02_36850 [Longispora fulva]|uniref:Uncharacterized protein YukE n=1 Tax=Longispora fulva TaxID=619741 RepID=A0A8J7GN77_9ACTN|nr:hypothetical protein [Longispora fulva]MBG6141536.1 uncharacterized protein YukE [Longispora fulva]GIG59313.1 hypothetical protein Lfu02_36850 [Longispora fulva]